MQQSIVECAQSFTAITAEDVEARAAIMEIPLYPDLSVRLKKALDYGPHVDIVQHLVYWFHPRHPKMQDRWTLYKTFDEWHEECGLAGRQVKKGRKRLEELGVLTWKRGQYGRVHYRVDWLALAGLLKISNPATVGGPIEDLDDDFEDFNPATVGGQIQSGHQGGPFNPATVGGRFNPAALPVDPIQETTQEVSSGDFFQESSPLQGAGRQKTDAPRRAINNDFEDFEEQLSAQPSDDERHSQDGDTQHEEQAAKDKVDEPKAPPIPEDPQLLADLREVLNPDSGRWYRTGAELIRKNYGSCKAYSPEGLAHNLEGEVDLPYAGRKDDLAQCLRYLFWEWDNETLTGKVA